ncbi:MAG: Uma2 family endonuclease [Zavarzinella sp.]|nr:Uma2 family endonuclease [Zavarzinella sp.]
MSVAELPLMPEIKVRTFADLLEELGDIPPSRIIMNPPPGTATEADVIRMHDHADRNCELIDGTLVEKAMGVREALLAAALIEILRRFVKPRNLGVVLGPDGAVRLWAGRVRMPDVAYYSWDRLPGRRIPDEPIPDLAPDLAIEVESANNTVAELKRKRSDYFRSNVRLVWQFHPRARTVAVYTSPDNPTILRTGDVIDGASVLPGFRLPVSDLFAELDQHG